MSLRTQKGSLIDFVVVVVCFLVPTGYEESAEKLTQIRCGQKKHSFFGKVLLFSFFPLPLTLNSHPPQALDV